MFLNFSCLGNIYSHNFQYQVQSQVQIVTTENIQFPAIYILMDSSSLRSGLKGNKNRIGEISNEISFYLYNPKAQITNRALQFI